MTGNKLDNLDVRMYDESMTHTKRKKTNMQ